MPRQRKRGSGRRGRRSRGAVAAGVLAPAIILSSFLTAAGARAVDGAASDVAIESGLRALHRGEFTRAVDEFERAARASPEAPLPLFFVVFSRWWQLIFGGSPASTSDPSFDQRVESTLLAARARLDEAPEDARALAALGGAQVLQSHVEAMRGNYFRSGQEARRGKKALDQALRIDGGLDLALFPAGALNYYADRVPLVVKGLRPLFFFPGGDAALGLRQIREVAEGHGRFRTDGRLLLAQVCADRYQQCYREALDHLRAALEENPGSPLIAAAIADLQIRLGEYPAAEETLTGAIGEAGGDAPEKSRQRQWLMMGLAEAQAGGWKIKEAQESLRQALLGPAPLPPSLQRTMTRVEEELRSKRAAASLLEDSPGAPDAPAVPASLDEAIRAAPDAPVPHFLRGRILLDAGRPEEALASLRQAERAAGGEPPWLAGWIELLSGAAEARLGHVKEARAHYRRGSGIRRFRAADRGRLELAEKGDDAAACAVGATGR